MLPVVPETVSYSDRQLATTAFVLNRSTKTYPFIVRALLLEAWRDTGGVHDTCGQGIKGTRPPNRSASPCVCHALKAYSTMAPKKKEEPKPAAPATPKPVEPERPKTPVFDPSTVAVRTKLLYISNDVKLDYCTVIVINMPFIFSF